MASSDALTSGAACCLAMAALGGGDLSVALLVGLICGAALAAVVVDTAGALAVSVLGGWIDSVCVSLDVGAGSCGRRS